MEKIAIGRDSTTTLGTRSKPGKYTSSSKGSPSSPSVLSKHPYLVGYCMAVNRIRSRCKRPVSSLISYLTRDPAGISIVTSWCIISPSVGDMACRTEKNGRKRMLDLRLLRARAIDENVPKGANTLNRLTRTQFDRRHDDSDQTVRSAGKPHPKSAPLAECLGARCVTGAQRRWRHGLA